MLFSNIGCFFWNAALTCSLNVMFRWPSLPTRAKSAFSTPPPLLRYGFLWLHWSGLKCYILWASSTSDVQVLFLVEARSPNAEPSLLYTWPSLSSPYAWEEEKKGFTSLTLQMEKFLPTSLSHQGHRESGQSWDKVPGLLTGDQYWIFTWPLYLEFWRKMSVIQSYDCT